MESNVETRKGFSMLNFAAWVIGLNVAWMLLAGVAAWLSWQSFNLTASGSVVQGRVARLLEDDASFTSDFTPVFEYQIDGQVYEVQSQNTYRWWNRYFRFPVGGDVEIRYDPANPETAEVNSLWDIWIKTILLSLFTALAAVGVNIYLFFRWRNRNH